jgi:hypothetical protein
MSRPTDPVALACLLPAASAYIAALDEALPGRLTGFLVTGSAVLGDWRPALSDLDFLAMTDTALTGPELGLLDRLHRRYRRGRRRPLLDGAFATWSQLAADPRGLVLPRVREGVFVPRNGYVANPVAWMTVARHPWALRGPEAPAAWSDARVLKDWCRDNLEGYWRGWIGKARREATSRLYSLSAEAAYWGTLGVARIHATIATGEILSKGAAAEWAHSRFGQEWGDLIAWAGAHRAGKRAPVRLVPWKRRRLCLDFMDMAIEDALRLAGSDAAAGLAPRG